MFLEEEVFINFEEMDAGAIYFTCVPEEIEQECEVRLTGNFFK